MRCAAWSGASQTMVMRETSVRSDSPTVSETMLMLRRRKSEATRVRTPGLSWTRATKVWSMEPRDQYSGLLVLSTGEEIWQVSERFPPLLVMAIDEEFAGLGLGLGQSAVIGRDDSASDDLLEVIPGWLLGFPIDVARI